jgi:hypothetical protein
VIYAAYQLGGSNLGLLICVASASAGEIPLLAGPLVPGAVGRASYEHDRNRNIKLAISASHLAPPERLMPAKTAYVVWLKLSNGQPQNAGVLKVNNDLQGSFRTVTPMNAFDIVITAEDNPASTQPTGPEVLHGSIQTRARERQVSRKKEPARCPGAFRMVARLRMIRVGFPVAASRCQHRADDQLCRPGRPDTSKRKRTRARGILPGRLFNARMVSGDSRRASSSMVLWGRRLDGPSAAHYIQHDNGVV